MHTINNLAVSTFSKKFVDVLKSHVNFNQTELDIILSKFKYRTVAKGKLLLQAGQPCRFWAFVISGLVRVFSYTPEGDEYANWFVKESELLTEFVSFFDGQTSSLENMAALEDTTIVYINYEALHWLMKEIAQFDKFCRVVYESKLIEMKRNILHRIRHDAMGRYLYFSEQYPDLVSASL
jgi:signal-transduction protein with cAMP-binding, CBS, and nucleotidyltransferase domain